MFEVIRPYLQTVKSRLKDKRLAADRDKETFAYGLIAQALARWALSQSSDGFQTFDLQYEKLEHFGSFSTYSPLLARVAGFLASIKVVKTNSLDDSPSSRAKLLCSLDSVAELAVINRFDGPSFDQMLDCFCAVYVANQPFAVGTPLMLVQPFHPSPEIVDTIRALAKLRYTRHLFLGGYVWTDRLFLARFRNARQESRR